MVLTNMLPNQGNGTVACSNFLRRGSARGTTQLLGYTHDYLRRTRTARCRSAPSIRRRRVEWASGASYVNFGWALTPQPKIDPVRRLDHRACWSTVRLSVTSTYNAFRSRHRQALFSRLCEQRNGAIGYRVLDTTALANGAAHGSRGSSPTTRARRRASAAATSPSRTALGR